MNLTDALNPFASKFYNLTLRSGFRAQLLATPMEESNTYFLLPRRILKLYPDAKTKGGHLIREEHSKKQFFCGENGPAIFGNRMIHKSLKLFEVTHPSATLLRREQVDDDITGLKKKVDDNSYTIPATIEFTKTQEDEMRIGADLVRIISNFPLMVNDRVNEYTIVNTETQLGLHFATARKMH
jgi:uncharacterized protein YeeX (DUF496 family)